MRWLRVLHREMVPYIAQEAVVRAELPGPMAGAAKGGSWWLVMVN